MIKSFELVMFMFMVGLLLACNSDRQQSNEFSKLSNRSASSAAQELYNKLKQYSQQGILVGHQDDVAYGIGWKDQGFNSDIYKMTGDFPAVFGWDLGHIHDTVNIDSVPFRRMKEWAIEVHARNGINTYGWHVLNFITNDNCWDVTPCVADILPEGSKNTEFNHKLDLIAEFFMSITEANGDLIPIIFRPWHEMNGSWFWWGKGNCSADEYKQLWIYTYKYLTEKHGLDNIIWCYSTDVFDTEEEYLEFYPGDAYVDILGFDDYKGVKEQRDLHKTVNRLEILSDLASEKDKLYTFSETGIERVENDTWFTENILKIMLENDQTRGAAYVLFWRNGRPDHYYVPYPGHSAEPDFVKFYNHSETLFLSDIKER